MNDRCPCGSRIYHFACVVYADTRVIEARINFEQARAYAYETYAAANRREVSTLAKAKKKSGKKKGAGSKMSPKTGKY